MVGAQRAFAGDDQSEREHWRSIVLFGRNVASYKFALAKSLLEIARTDTTTISLPDLAVPFAAHICEHLQQVDRQGTFAHSRFLDACRYYNAGRITADELREITVVRGFQNVIDAFHVVGDGDVPTRFFVDERSTGDGLRLTDALLELATSLDGADLSGETEARWRLVETAWDARADHDQVVVLYDAPTDLLVGALKGKRRNITEVRPALNGYQKGHCFYCFTPIHIVGPTNPDTACAVDHFLPHVLMARGMTHHDLDVPWNLVLACVRCNSTKSDNVPHLRYVQRLYTRNEHLIASNHPLRDHIIEATGARSDIRRRFLTGLHTDAQRLDGTRSGWTTPQEGPALF